MSSTPVDTFLSDSKIYCFDRIKYLVTVSGKLKALTQIHVGGGESGTQTVDNPFALVTRVTQEGISLEPYIPGSSIRGIIRSRYEALARSIADDDGRISADRLINLGLTSVVPPRGIHTPGEVPAKEGSNRRRVEFDCHRVGSCADGGVISLGEGDDFLCLSCVLFGSAWPGRSFSGRVKVSDSMISDEFRQLLADRGIRPIDIMRAKPGIAIDRILGTVSRGRLFTVQVVPPGTEFEFRLNVINVGGATPEMRLLASVIREMGSDSVIGGGSSRGLGRFILTGVTVRVRTAADLLRGSEGSEISLNDLAPGG